MSQNAKIYLRTKDVIDVPKSQGMDPQHSYLVADFGGKQYILRAGPSGKNPIGGGGNALIGDLKFTGAENLVEYSPINSYSTHYDWDFENNHNTFEIYSGSDAEVANKFQILRQRATEINLQNLDYRWNNQNCNTAIAYVLREAGFKTDLNNLYDKNGEKLWMIGSDEIIIFGKSNLYEETINSFFEFTNSIKEKYFKIKINNDLIVENGDISQMYADSGLIKSDAIFVNEDGDIVDKSQVIFQIKNKDGNIYTISKANSGILNEDKSITTLDKIITNFKENIAFTEDYIKSSFQEIIDEYSSPDGLASLVLIINDGLNKNLSIQEISQIISIRLTVKSLLENLQNKILFSPEDYEKISAGNFEEISSEAIVILDAIRNSSLYKISYISAISFTTEVVLRKGDLNAQQYSQIAVTSIAQASAKTAIEEIFKSEFLKNIYYSSSVYQGITYGVAQIISTVISDFFADDKMNSHQWQSSLSSAGVVACAAGVGSAIASAIYAGACAGPVGAAVAVVLAYTLMGGKKLEEGEYFDKINFYNSILKENGVDSNFYALDQRGTMIKASPYYHDDIYGNIGDDSLIGGNGTNKIIAYDGNDQIFGKNDNDIIFGNAGFDEILAGNGDDYAFGGDGDDIIFGGAGDDIIFGGEIEIGKNNEIIKISKKTSDDDLIRGGLGNDQIYAQEGDDLIFGDEGDDLIFGEEGDDIILGGSGLNFVKAGDGNDIIFAGQNGDNIYGERGNDEIFGGENNDIIYGGEGDDVIDGEMGRDLIFGGEGDDIIYAGNEIIQQKNLETNYQNSIHGDLGNDYLIGSNVDDLISDGEGSDVIYGGLGNDEIILGEGNNSIFFNKGDGEDLIEIFQGESVFEVDNFGENIIRFCNFNFNSNSQKSIQIQKNQNDLIINFFDQNNNILDDKIIIENQYYSQSNLNKILVKTLEFDNNLLIDLQQIEFDVFGFAKFNFDTKINQEVSIQQEFLNAYQDQISIAKDLNNINFLGSNNNENIFKNNAGEIAKIDNEILNQIEWISIKKQRNIFGGHYQVWRENYKPMITLDSENSRAIGNFWSENIYGNLYQNQINGGSGDDKILGFAGDDVLFGGTGNDIINGGADDDLILGGGGQDQIEGNLGNDEIYGNEGNDFIRDLNGKNLIFGGGGEDEIIISNSGNQIFGETGNDRIRVDNLSNKILINFSNQDLKNNNNEGNIIYANSGEDSIIGGNGDDYIFGQNGADFIDGGVGKDYISGGEGSDQINGNDGDDKIFGDIGDDFIKGGLGNDLIWGGSGIDFIECEDGDDLVRAGFGDDEIYAGFGNDKIYGEAGADRIFLQNGNNYAFGGLGGDIIFGGNGDDKIFGEDGDDFTTDGSGSDFINGGLGNDLIIIESLKNQPRITDIIENFNKDSDKIIIKTDYKNPLSFTQLINNSKQVGKDLELNLNQDQKIIFLDTKINDLNQENLKIGYAINGESKILFGENSGQILFGDEKNNQIFGSDFNDDLFGGGGYDELFGMKGDDILRYEVDDKFIKLEQQIFSDEIGYYKTREVMLSKMVVSDISPTPEYYYYKPSNKSIKLLNNTQNSAFESSYDLTNIGKISQYAIPISSSRVQYEAFRSSSYVYLQSVDKVNFLYNKISHFSTTNFHNLQNYEITGYNKSNDNFDGGEGFNSILMTNGNDFLSFDDNSQIANSASRIKSIEAIFAFDGDDIINFSSQKFSIDKLMVRGGLGNDKLWLSAGNDFIFGDEGNDEIFGGKGNDFINGGVGDDIVFAGEGDDIVDGYIGVDKIYLEAGNDIIYCGENNQEIIGGSGIDQINLNNFTSGIKVDLTNNFIQKNQQNSKIIIREIENIIASNFDDEIIGDINSNYINSVFGDDLISGGGGNDIYFFDENHGVDKIIESGNDIADSIKFLNGIRLENLSFERVGNNLEIFTDKQKTHKIIIENQFIDNPKIDLIQFSDGSTIEIPRQFLIFEEDQEIIFSEQYFQKNFDSKKQLKNLIFNSRNGNFIFDQIAPIVAYKINKNFNGFDEIEIIDQDLKSEKILIYFNQKNDKPEGFINDFSFKVNQEIIIDFNQYFQDADADKISFNLSLAGFNELPNWLNFNQEIGILETKIPRTGSLNFKIKVFDKNGGEVEQFFKINLSRDIVQDVNKIVNKNQINGDAHNNKIYAQTLSNDVVSAESGDDEIFYVEDAKWQNNETINFRAWNIYSGDEFDVSNKIKSFDCFDGGSGYDILHLTQSDDALFLDDQNLSDFGEIAKFSDIEEIRAGNGDDIVDMTSFNFIYGNIKILGESGNDILWSSSGDDEIYGGNGDDNIQSAIGDDKIFGEEGDDILKAYYGNDLLFGGLGSDQLLGGDGMDIFLYEDKSESNNYKQDLIKDFEINFDKIVFKNLEYNSIYKYSDIDINQLPEGSKPLFYKIDNNLNTIIFDNNSDFSIMLSGQFELTNDNFFYG